MELSARKRAVLAAIIRTYIETGEPVGSKILTGLLENAPSSATLRNEMSELCSLGLLTQPHTSAGRIPTNEGFSFYVNSLMKPKVLDESTKQYIDSSIQNAGYKFEELPRLAGKALSNLTGLPAITCFTSDKNVNVRKVGNVKISKSSMLLYLITSDGRVKSRICHIPERFESFEGKLQNLVKEKILRRPLADMNRAGLQNIIASIGLDAFELMPVITAIFEMAAEAAKSSVNISGFAGLYRVCGEDNARRIIELVERREPMIRLLESTDGEQGVIFGSDTRLHELYGTALVVSEYNIGGRKSGRIGIIGPARMSYDQIIPSIEYAAERLSQLMTDAVKDMED